MNSSQVWMSLLLISALSFGCVERPPVESYTQGTALVGVSDAVFELGAHVAQQYQMIHPAAFLSVYRHDTRSLIDSLINERVEEIFIDRTLSPAETLAFAKAELRLWTYSVAYYPVYLLVDSTTGVTSLDSAALREILTGRITNWKQVGGINEIITPYLPLPGCGAWSSIINYYGELDSIVAVACSTDERMLELSLEDPGALLIYSHPYDEVPERFARLRWAIGEYRVPANVKTILERPTYPFHLKFTYVTTHNKIDVASGYLTFLVENNGQKMIMQKGYRPASVPVRVIHMRE